MNSEYQTPPPPPPSRPSFVGMSKEQSQWGGSFEHEKRV